MCKSQRDGGQRCFSHALKRYKAALDARAIAPFSRTDPQRIEAETQVHARLVELASTPKGAEMIATERDRTDNPFFDHDYCESVLRQGAELAERSKALGALTREERSDRFQTRGTRIAKTLGQAVVPVYTGGHALAVSDNLAIQVTAGAAATLGAGLAVLKARKQERTRPWMSPRESEMRTALRIEKDDAVLAERRASTPADDGTGQWVLARVEKGFVEAQAGQGYAPDVTGD